MEVLDISGLLARLEPYKLSPIERVLVGHTGTVQLHLSLLFGDPIDVILEEQSQDDQVIFRKASLVLRTSGSVACYATSEIAIERNLPEIVEDVSQGLLGIGQIAAKFRIPTERTLQEVHVDQDWIVRTYKMEGPGLFYIVTERFPRELYRTSLHTEPWSASLTKGAESFENAPQKGSSDSHAPRQNVRNAIRGS